MHEVVETKFTRRLRDKPLGASLILRAAEQDLLAYGTGGAAVEYSEPEAGGPGIYPQLTARRISQCVGSGIEASALSRTVTVASLIIACFIR